MVDRPRREQWFPSGTTRALLIVGVAAVGLAAIWWVTGRPTTSQVPVQRSPAVSPATSLPLPSPSPPNSAVPLTGSITPTAESAAVTVTVDVRGRVASPGIRRLPAGSRVMDAVRMAGGLLPGHHYGAVNLARLLVDGEQIRVGESVAAATPQSDAVTSTATSPALTAIDLNTATAAELEDVDGVGPVLAAAIVQWRTDNGPFQSVDDLLDVSGIGEATLAGMRDQVTVG